MYSLSNPKSAHRFRETLFTSTDRRLSSGHITVELPTFPAPVDMENPQEESDPSDGIEEPAIRTGEDGEVWGWKGRSMSWNSDC